MAWVFLANPWPSSPVPQHLQNSRPVAVGRWTQYPQIVPPKLYVHSLPQLSGITISLSFDQLIPFFLARLLLEKSWIRRASFIYILKHI